MDFLSTLSQPKRLILDGATGTELNRRGVDTGLPLWSANALMNDNDANILKQIHLDYLNAGADMITTNTFRTHQRALSGNSQLALELTQRAVDIARAAIHTAQLDAPKFIAGSISTLADCYRPELAPPEAELRAEHGERVQHLIQSGVDLILIETINTIREAVIIAELATRTNIPVIVSFVCNPSGKILSGETLTQAAHELMPLGIIALGVNCGATPNLKNPLLELQNVCGADFPLIAYGNIGYADEKTGWVNTDSEDPKNYCKHALHWNAKIIGGCCGTTPEHIRELTLSLK